MRVWEVMMPDTYTCLKYHLVFATRERTPWLVESLRGDLYDYIGAMVVRRQALLLAIGGVEDHVHLLISFRPAVALAEVVRQIKAISSKWINERPDFDGTFAWQKGYAAFTVSESQVPTVRRYILRQEQHHHRSTFDTELQHLAIRHGLTWEGPPTS